MAVTEAMEPEELKIFTIWLFPEKSLFTFVIDDVKPHFGAIKARKKKKNPHYSLPRNRPILRSSLLSSQLLQS